MVAGSLSMCVSTESISGASRRISASSAVTKPCASRSGMFSSSSTCCSTRRRPWCDCTLSSCTRNVVARGHGAHAVEDALRPGFAGHGVDDHVGLGQRAMHGLGGRLHQFAGVLKGEAPRQRQREVGKITGAGAAHARLLHGQHALHLLHFAHQLPPGLGRNLVHQARPPLRGPAASVMRRIMSETTTAANGSAIAQPGDPEARAHPSGAQPGQHRQRGPDVGGKMKGVGGQRR